MKKIRIYIFNILLCLCIMFSILIISKVTPFGPYSFGNSDGPGQFQPMIYNFLMKLRYGILSSYSFNNGLGNPTYFNCLYYVTSPINYFGLLTKKPEIMYLIIGLIKLVISACTMTFYSSKKTDKKEIIIISTISYVFCSWYIVYYYYSTWNDLFMIFPLFQYGLEELINNNKNKIYIFTLSYMLCMNFYLCFAVCLYTFIYFMIYNFFYKNDSIKEKFKRFTKIAFSTIIVFILSFGVIYALIDAYKRMGLNFDSSNVLYYNTNIKEVVKSLFYGDLKLIVEKVKIVKPNIACNSLILLSYINLFLNEKVNKKDKLFCFVASILVVLVLTLKPLDYAFNMFHKIRGLVFRYSFIVCFLFVKAYIHNSNYDDGHRHYDYRRYISYLIILLLLLSVIPNIRKTTRIINASILLCLFITDLFVNKTQKTHKIFTIIIIILQTIIVGCDNFEFALEIKDYQKQIFNTKTTKYRLGITNVTDVNENKYFDNYNQYTNTNTTATLTSMTYVDVIYLARDLGNPIFFNVEMTIDLDNLVSRMIFNEKEDFYHRHYLEKIFSVNKELKNVIIKKRSSVENQKNVIKGMTGIDTVFTKIKLKGEKKYNLCYVNVDDIEMYQHIYYFNNYDKNRSIIIPKKYCDEDIDIYVYNKEKLDKAYEYLKKNQIDYTYYSDSRIEGTINVEENQIIYTSIPYDTNWNIYIDGKRTEPIKLLTALTGIEVPPGKHKIKMEYKVNFTLPFLVSLTTFIAIIVDILYKRIRRKNII